jgi:parallel beta-helix repeat protein
MTGAYTGVWLGDSSGSERFRLEGSDIYGHATYGVYVGSGNADALIEGNAVHENTQIGVCLVNSTRARVVGNDVWGNGGEGINATYGGALADRIELVGNRVHNNVTNGNRNGLQASGWVRVEGNEVWGHTATGCSGIYASGVDAAVLTDEVVGNTVWGNYYGIYSIQAKVADNVVWGNSVCGIVASYTEVSGNRVYNNATGISASNLTRVEGNLVYANSNVGVSFVREQGTTGGLYNNTIYQSVGSAVYLGPDFYGNATNVRLANNILWVDGGYAINVDNAAQVGFSSDYNLFHLTGTGQLAYWQGRAWADRANWTRSEEHTSELQSLS